MNSGLFDLATIILIATALGIAARVFKQPTVLAYLIAGAVIGYFGLFHLDNKATFQTFSDLGIMFLLFLVGMEINYTSLRLVGKVSLIIGLGQIIFTFAIGWLIALLFGFAQLPAAYIAIALTFSSTIIIVKLLSEKRDMHSLYGKISIGMLLVQDFVAILLLVLLVGIQTGDGFSWVGVVFTVFKGALLFALMLWMGRKVLPLIFDRIARSQELLFLTSLAWAFLVVALVDRVGFSLEIGGFLAGIALANSSEHFEIASKVKSLRDFFIVIFFVILGSSIIFSSFDGLSLPIIIFSLFVLIGNPLIILVLMGLMGYRRRTAFLCGLTVAQISEFSLVLAALGLKLGHITEPIVALITAVGVITITLSSYLITYSNEIFRILSPYLRIFEKKNAKDDHVPDMDYRKPIVLIGCHRTGQSIAFNLPKQDVLIIDADPEIIQQMKKDGYAVLFGDITDSEIFEKANFVESKLIISTSPDLEDNLFMLSELNKLKNRNSDVRAKIVLRAEDEKEAKILYDNNADYVLLPHFTSGRYLGKILEEGNNDGEILETLRDRDLSLMQKLHGENAMRKI